MPRALTALACDSFPGWTLRVQPKNRDPMPFAQGMGSSVLPTGLLSLHPVTHAQAWASVAPDCFRRIRMAGGQTER
jgi:hypothetical protein